MSTTTAFAGASLRFHVAGEGVTIDPESGVLSILTDALASGLEVTVTAANSEGSASQAFRLTVAAVAPEVVAPAIVAAPSLRGCGVIGFLVELDPGSWSGSPEPVLSYQWRRDGVDIEGAHGLIYVPRAEDDRAALSCLVTASNSAGSAAAETASVVVTFAAPEATGELADVGFEQDSGAHTVGTAAVFSGEGLVFTVEGAGAAIDAATGVVTIDTAELRDAERIVVTASNSGGSVETSFRVTIIAAEPETSAPEMISAPRVSGSGIIGTVISVDPGVWSGEPEPVLSLQWRRDGADIPGATGGEYTVVTADDRAAVTCFVTATNAAGSAAAETVALVAVHPAPVMAATLSDLQLIQGSGVQTVSAQAAFDGAALVFSLDAAPEGVTIDAGSGLVSIATDAAIAAAVVLVRAENSGGAVVASFKLDVQATATDFDTALALETVEFLDDSGAPSWTSQTGGFARLVPAVGAAAHGDWSRAAGDGIYRCLARWNGSTASQPGERPFSFGARVRKDGRNFFGIRLDVYQVNSGNRQLQLRQYTGGSNGSLALAPGVAADWSWNEWHWVELAVEGEVVRGRIYPEAGAAPDWQVTAIATELSAGAFGPGSISRNGASPSVDIRRLEYLPASQKAEAPAAPLDSDWDIAQFMERK